MLAALLNALKLTGKRPEDLNVLMVGLGAAGIAVTKILLDAGVRNIIGCDSRGALHTERADYPTARCPRSSAGSPSRPTPTGASGGPDDVIEGADLFIGLSGAGRDPPRGARAMNHDAMVFAMANPTPEVTPEEAGPTRARHRHRPLGLPEPDQQRALLPGHLPRRARRPRPRRSPRR